MKQQKGSIPRNKVLWRMSEAVPLGEFVDVAKEAATAAARPVVPSVTPLPGKTEVSRGSWLESSFELLNGTEVNDGPDTVPDDLFDELFAPQTVSHKPAPK